MNIILKAALEKTYRRAIDSKKPYATTLSAVLGLQYKYKRNPYSLRAKGSWDRNIYNWFEQIVFIGPRLAKNFLKLGTELFWHLANLSLNRLASYFSFKSFEAKSKTKKYFYLALKYVSKFFSILARVLAKIGQSITSPFSALKDTRDHVLNRTRSKAWAYLATGLHGLLIMALYGALAASLIPLIAAPLAASGIVGSKIVAGITAAINWVASLPAISSIGAAFVDFILGTSLSAASAFTGAIAAIAIIATPVLAGLKALTRYLSPFKSKEADDATASRRGRSSTHLMRERMHNDGRSSRLTMEREDNNQAPLPPQAGNRNAPHSRTFRRPNNNPRNERDNNRAALRANHI